MLGALDGTIENGAQSKTQENHEGKIEDPCALKEIEPKGAWVHHIVDEKDHPQDWSLAIRQGRTTEGSMHTEQEGNITMYLNEGRDPKSTASKNQIAYNIGKIQNRNLKAEHRSVYYFRQWSRVWNTADESGISKKSDK